MCIECKPLWLNPMPWVSAIHDILIALTGEMSVLCVGTA